MATFILKGALVSGTLSDNNISRAQFVRIVAQAQAVITVKNSDGDTLGTTQLYAAGDEITIEKAPGDTISSSANVSATAVAPRN